MATAVLLLLLAFRIYAPPPIALAILALPMYLYLVSSAALDGLTIAASVVSLSLFARIVTVGEREQRWVFPALIATIVVLACCRANLLPMLLLPLACALESEKGRSWKVAVAIMATVVAMAWTLYAIKSTVYPPGPRDVDHGARLMEFILHPTLFVKSLWITIADISRTGFYVQSFIGILGWLDTYLPSFAYRALAILLAVLAVCSFTSPVNRVERRARLLLTFCAVSAIVLTFLALLVQWVPPGTQVITGIQGRYFIVPSLMLAYALATGRNGAPTRRQRIVKPLLLTVMTLSTAVTIYAVTTRYYVPADPNTEYRQPPA